ncbi:hypothetical protein [Nonomuraea turcica]|uniref:hypothetical protein n=1 Tax=Nonomuraea sp. G32 TaxID=3067274 RepID=UPI00273CC18E|nr:hypothetical protein [Nonomuraea sp. G32]MDP4505780.1 hypothetical protein [Nonomuraea sp. G32]
MSSDCKGRVELRLQRQRWYGWETMARDTWDTKWSNRRAVVYATCKGTHNWRVWMYSDSAGAATAGNTKISC